MAKIIGPNSEKELQDGSGIQSTCESLGVQFSCSAGVCGVCAIDVKEGEGNLSELTQSEKDFGKDKKHRLACQCKIKSGDVKIDF